MGAIGTDEWGVCDNQTMYPDFDHSCNRWQERGK